MPQTRETYYPGGPYGGDVIKQELIGGRWLATGARKLMPHETPESLMTNTPVAGKSGSSNSHARFAPSASSRWGECTAVFQLEAENEEKIFLQKLDKTRKLVPYLQTFPDELHDHEVRAIGIIEQLDAGKLKVAKLTPEQRKDILRSEGSTYSREGTRAHDFSEAILNGRREIESLPEEFQVPVRHYIEHVRSLVPEGATPLIEVEVPLFYDPASTDPASTGTADFAIITDERVWMRDLKYGSGDLVSSFENPQLAIYAMSLMKDAEESGLYEFSPDTVVDIMIVQPRHHEADNAKPWIVTYKDLQDFCDEIEATVTKIRSGEGLAFVPSEKACKYCDCKAWCSARAEWLTSALDNPDAGYSAIDLLSELPEDGEIPDMKKKDFQKLPVAERLTSRLEYASNGRISALTDDQMVALWSNKSGIGKLLDDIEEHLKARVLNGEKVEGLKVVLGRAGNREWVDEEKVKTFLRGQGLKLDEYTERKLLGPAKVEALPALAEKMEKVKRTATTFAGLITRSDAKKTIATMDDDRPEVAAITDELPDEPDAEEDFDLDDMLG